MFEIVNLITRSLFVAILRFCGSLFKFSQQLQSLVVQIPVHAIESITSDLLLIDIERRVVQDLRFNNMMQRVYNIIHPWTLHPGSYCRKPCS